MKHANTKDAAARSAAWWSGETQIRLDAVPELLPPRADGSRISPSTVYRWTTAGTHGVRLRRFAIGGAGFATTAEELQRFLAALTALRGEDVA